MSHLWQEILVPVVLVLGAYVIYRVLAVRVTAELAMMDREAERRLGLRLVPGLETFAKRADPAAHGTPKAG